MELAQIIIIGIIILLITLLIMKLIEQINNYIQIKTVDHIVMVGKHQVEYSNALLSNIRELVAEVAVLEFNQFRDSHDMEKITLANIKTIAKDVAEKSIQGLNLESINYVNLLYTKDFIESYVIKSSMEIVKGCLDRSVNPVD